MVVLIAHGYFADSRTQEDKEQPLIVIHGVISGG